MFLVQYSRVHSVQYSKVQYVFKIKILYDANFNFSYTVRSCKPFDENIYVYVVCELWMCYVYYCSSPGKAEVLAFKVLYPSLEYSWETIRTKVLNEQKAFAKRKRIRLYELSWLLLTVVEWFDSSCNRNFFS